MKIRIDDTFKCISDKDSGDDIFRFRSRSVFDFHLAMKTLLTETQFQLFVEHETRRTFTVSEKKITETANKFPEAFLL